MLRIYRQLAFRLMTTLIYFKSQFRNQTHGTEVREEVLRNWQLGQPNGNEYRAWADTLNFMFDREKDDDFEFETDKLINELARSLMSSFDKTKDSDLIETIADLLKKNRGINVLAGKTLESLRKAILLPDELAEVKRNGRKNTYSCGMCARSIQNGDVLTIGVNIQGDNVIVCSSCVMPTLRHCGNNNECENRLELSKKTIKGLHEQVECDTCKWNREHPEEAKKVEEEAERAEPARPAERFRGMEIHQEEFLDDDGDLGPEEDEEWLPEDEPEVVRLAEATNRAIEEVNQELRVWNGPTPTPPQPATTITMTPPTPDGVGRTLYYNPVVTQNFRIDGAVTQVVTEGGTAIDPIATQPRPVRQVTANWLTDEVNNNAGVWEDLRLRRNRILQEVDNEPR